MGFPSVLKASIAGVALWYGFIFADHVYMVNGASYPLWASESVTVKSTGDSGIEGFTEMCGGVGGWTFYIKENGSFMRCSTIITGSIGRPKTYLIENYDQLADEPLQ